MNHSAATFPNVKVLESIHYTLTRTLFEDLDGKLWELNQDSTGRSYWWPVFEAERSGWAENANRDIRHDGLIGEGAGAYPMTHEQRRVVEQ